MDQVVHDFIHLVLSNKGLNKKDDMIRTVEQCFCLNKTGALYRHNDSFAVAFAYCKYDSFPNVVSSLKTLKKHDDIPCFVVVVKREMENSIYMINSTFLDKISHSSQKLSMDKIVGSFLGNDIRKSIDEIKKENKADDFDELFSYHKRFTWEQNLERLVEVSSGISQKKGKVEFSDERIKNIQDAPERACKFVGSECYTTLLKDLNERCERVKDAILLASKNDNRNIRGRLIEALITSEQNEREQLLKDLGNGSLLPSYKTRNSLSDYHISTKDWDVYIDIKTKTHSNSNPKAYNINKFLKCMGESNSVFLFFFIVIDDQCYQTALVSVFHKELLNVYTQTVWSGRGTRGTAQFKSETIKSIFQNSSFTNCINVKESKEFLEKLMER